jgi:hypothetical protein
LNFKEKRKKKFFSFSIPKGLFPFMKKERGLFLFSFSFPILCFSGKTNNRISLLKDKYAIELKDESA